MFFLRVIGILIFFQPMFLMAQEKNDKTQSPYFFVKSDDAKLDVLPLKNTSVDVTISGIIANVRVNQVYVNSGKKPLEAVYLFPLSTNAAIYSMKMRIADRIITAQIEEKEKARKRYEKAKRDGKSASLLEQKRPNVFSMNVANIMPNDTITVEITYVELLIPTDGIYEFVYPTVVGPRYQGTENENIASTDEWISNPYTEENVKPNSTFNISTTINAGLPIDIVKCQSHSLNIKYEGKNTALWLNFPEAWSLFNEKFLKT